VAREVLRLAQGVEVKATTVRSKSCLAVHRSLDGKGFVLTHLPTLRCVGRRRLQREALDLRKALDALDWSDPEAVREEVCSIVDAQ